SFATGIESIAYIYTSQAYSSGSIAADGDAQSFRSMLRATTTDDSETEMFINYSTNSITLDPAGTAFGQISWNFEITFMAIADSKSMRTVKLEGAAYFDGGTGRIVGTTTTIIDNMDAGNGAWIFDVTIANNGSNDYLKLQVKGEN